MREGTSPLSYQWKFNNTNILNATNDTLVFNSVQASNTGLYSVSVTNAFGSTNSSNAVLTVLPNYSIVWSPIPSPRFVTTPFNVTIRALDTNDAVFTNFNNAVLLTSSNGVAINPNVSGNFTQGVWTGSITVTQVGRESYVLEGANRCRRQSIRPGKSHQCCSTAGDVDGGFRRYILYYVADNAFGICIGIHHEPVIRKLDTRCQSADSNWWPISRIDPDL